VNERRVNGKRVIKTAAVIVKENDKTGADGLHVDSDTLLKINSHVWDVCCIHITYSFSHSVDIHLIPTLCIINIPIGFRLELVGREMVFNLVEQRHQILTIDKLQFLCHHTPQIVKRCVGHEIIA
jgi:hypothetical protein